MGRTTLRPSLRNQCSEQEAVSGLRFVWINATLVFCPAERREAKMRIQKNAFTCLIVLGLWLLLALGCSSFKKAVEEKRAEREGPGITVSADDLYKAYQSNDAEAD